MTVPNSLSLSNFVGLADQVYKDENIQKQVGDTLTINGSRYTVVIKPVDDPTTSYQGMVLLDETTRSLIVVDRGTQEGKDFAVDAAMADKDVNLQWPDALNLAQQAADYAAANGITNIYTTGHSLGGTLAQMQAAYFGWKGVTFNAYGADEVFKSLHYTVNPNADITNYRTMYDLVSDASVQIGEVKTLETPDDQKLFASGISNHPFDFIKQMGADHSLSNFFEAGTDITGTQNTNDPGDHIYQEIPAFDFAPSPRTVAIAQDQVAAAVATLELVVGNASAELHLPFFPRNIQDMRQAAVAAWEYLTNQSLTGMSADIPSDPMLLQNALNPDAANNVYRAALVAGSPVVLQGADPTQVASFSLWAPGQSSGLTKEYLIARDGLVQTRVKMAGEGYFSGSTVTTDSQNSYIYTDLSQSPNPLYTLVGKGPDTYSIKFGTDGNDVLSPTAGTLSEVFGGAGDDMLVDGSGRSTLEGGAGNDTYSIISADAGTDHILDTDGQGDIDWLLPDGSGPILTGGDAVPGGLLWKSADGSITYTELAQADGTTELEIHGGNKTVFVDDFTNGELGITLNNGDTTAPGAGNLGNFTKTTYTDHTEYQDLSGTGGGDSMDGVTTTGGNYNILEGEGNASYIYAGDGNNDVFANDMRYSPVGEVFSYPLSVMIQGGSGDQLLVGMGDDGSQGNA